MLRRIALFVGLAVLSAAVAMGIVAAGEDGGIEDDQTGGGGFDGAPQPLE